MKLLTPIALFTIATMALAGCDSEEDPTPMEPAKPTPRNVDPVDGGGTAGGAIDGVMTVFVLDDDNKPIQGAIVMVKAGAEVLSEKTDDDGRIDVWGDGLSGATDVHIFANGYRYISVFGINASVFTVDLDSTDKPMEPAATITTVTGTVSGWSMLPMNTPMRAQVALVSAVGEDLDRVDQDARPGTVTPGDPDGSEHNIVLHGTGACPSWDDYKLKYDTRATALVAFGGSFTLGAQPPIELTHLGISMLTNTASGAAVNIEMTHALDQSLQAVVSNAPTLDETRVVFGVELDEGGLIVLGAPEVVMGQAEANAPALRDALSKGKYMMAVSLRSQTAMGEEPELSAFAVSRGPQTSVTFDKILAPPGAITAAGRTVAAEPSTGATMMSFEFTKGDRQLWEATVLGDMTRSFELPAVPDTFTDPLAGELDVEVSAMDFGNVDLNNTKFDALEDASVSSAMRRGKVSF